MVRTSTWVLCVFSFVFFGAGSASAVPYFLTDLGPLGSDTISLSYAVSLVGGSPTAVGFSQDFAGSGTTRTPVTWNSGGTPTSFLGSIPGASVATPRAIAGNGDIAGVATIGGVQRAFYLPHGGTATTLPDLGTGSPASLAAGVSNDGTVVGYSYGTDGLNHAVAWPSSGGIIDLGLNGSTVGTYATAISADGNTIVGSWDDTPGQLGNACKWTKSGSTWSMSIVVPDSTYHQSVGLSINASGDIAGSCFDYGSSGPPAPDVEAILVKHDGTVVRLGSIGSNSAWAFSQAYGINDSGVIVGSADTVGPAWVNYTGEAGGNIDLSTLLVPGSGTGWTLKYAYGIDNRGDIVGRGTTPGGTTNGFLLRPAMVGDANLDGVVDISDLSVVLTNYDKSGMVWAQGDFDGNGVVDINDLSKILTNYDKSISAAAGIHAVPEPSALLLAALGLLGLAIGRGRRSQ
jgi:probable HAF family extracellular repeat protein